MMKTYRRPARVSAGALRALFVLAHHATAASTAMPGAGQAQQMNEPSKAGSKHCCGCECCKSGCPDGKECSCGHRHGGYGIPPMKEGLKKHLEVVLVRMYAFSYEALINKAVFIASLKIIQTAESIILRLPDQ
jgi:hypothetical protein